MNRNLLFLTNNVVFIAIDGLVGLPLSLLGAALPWLASHRRGTQNLRSTAGG